MKEVKTEIMILRTFEYYEKEMDEQIKHMADMIRSGYNIQDFSWGKVQYSKLEG